MIVSSTTLTSIFFSLKSGALMYKTRRQIKGKIIVLNVIPIMTVGWSLKNVDTMSKQSWNLKSNVGLKIIDFGKILN